MRIIKFLLVLLFVPLLFSCSDDDKTNSKEVIPTSTFVLSQGYEWKKNYGADGQYIVGNLYKIDSQEEFLSVCDSKDQKLIDFEEYTLLFAYVTSPQYGIGKITSELTKKDSSLQLDIDLYYDNSLSTTVPKIFVVPILVNKLSKTDVIQMKLIEHIKGL